MSPVRKIYKIDPDSIEYDSILAVSHGWWSKVGVAGI